MNVAINKAVLDSLRQVGDKIRQNDKDNLKRVIEERRNSSDLLRMITNHSLTFKDASKACGQSINTFKETYRQAVEQKVVPEVKRDGSKYLFTLKHMHNIMDWMGRPKWQDTNPHCHIVNVENQKGGTGKTTYALTLAAACALPLQDRMRVLLIDLDPQGSQRNSTVPTIEYQDEDFLTPVDLMLGEEEPDSVYQSIREQGFSHLEILQRSILPTHIPNLDILPSFSEDERFSAMAWEHFSAGQGLKHISYLKDKIIDLVKADYDLIIIDTGPHVNPLVWAAQEASNGMIIPFTPKKLDLKSTGTFIRNLPEQILKNLPSQGRNLKWWRAMAVNYDDEHHRDTDMLSQARNDIGKHLFHSVLKKSSAFEAAHKNFCTIFDFIKSEGLCPPKQLEKAQSSAWDMRREFLFQLQDISLTDSPETEVKAED
jgi:chromosome partitioning protein